MTTTATSSEPLSVRAQVPEDRHAALVGELLRRAGDERIEIARLTDEEVTVLDGSSAPQIAPCPWYTRLDKTKHDLALAVAARGLAARRVLTPTTIDDAEAVSFAIEPAIHGVLLARRSASAVVFAERVTAHASWSTILYRQGAVGVIDEVVSPAGLHTFHAGPVAAVIDALVAFTDPEDTATHDTDHIREIALTDLATGNARLDELGEARYATVVTALRLDTNAPSEQRLSIFAHADRVEIAQLTTEDDKTMHVQAVSAPTLRRAIANVMAES